MRRAAAARPNSRRPSWTRRGPSSNARRPSRRRATTRLPLAWPPRPTSMRNWRAPRAGPSVRAAPGPRSRPAWPRCASSCSAGRDKTWPRRDFARSQALRRFPMHMKSKLLAAALAVALAACQTTSPRAADALSQARGAVNAARADAQAARFASAEVDRAQQELTRAETAWNSDKDVEKTVHFAYLAAQRAEIARTLGAQAGDEDRLKLASAERERIQLEARARATEARTRDVAAAAAVAVASANADARQAQSDADAQRMRAAALERDLQSLQGRQTERGLVITMNDVLFNTGGATLQPGAQQTVTRLAQVLREYPERRVMIEGFTDNTGSDALNMQ